MASTAAAESCEAGCGRKAKAGGLCWACRKQRWRTGSTVRTHPQFAVRYPSLSARFLEVSLALADADTEDDRAFRRAQWRMRHALRAHMRKGLARVAGVPRQLDSPTTNLISPVEGDGSGRRGDAEE